MQISNKLPQFMNDVALLIVTGDKESNFFIASNGVIKKADAFISRRPVYSDNEGFTVSQGGNGVYQSGSVREIKKQFLWKEFLHHFIEEMKHLVNEYNITKIYLFSPDYFIKNVVEALPNDLKVKIKHTEAGNYNKLHPVELIKKIKDIEVPRITIARAEPTEVLNLLQKEEAARQVDK